MPRKACWRACRSADEQGQKISAAGRAGSATIAAPMKFSRQWLNDYVDLSDLSDDQLGVRLTEIGHAVEATEQHGDDTVFDLEITTNRVDAMSHIGMARELAAALGRSTTETSAAAFGATSSTPPTIRIEAP